MARTYLDYDGLLYFWEKLKSKLSTELSEKVDKVSGKGLSSNDLTDALVTKINQAEKNVITAIKVNGSEAAPDSSRTVSITVPPDNSQLANGAGYQTAADVSAAIPIRAIRVNGSEAAPDGSGTVSITVPTDNSQLANGAGYQTAANVNAAIAIKSIKVNGTTATPNSSKVVSITVPTNNNQLTNGAGYQTASDVSAAIADALGGVTGISYQIVGALPETGEAGVIYLVAHPHGDTDSYDEYIWTGSAYEKIGNTDVDLSGYVRTAELSAISNSQIDTICAS